MTGFHKQTRPFVVPTTDGKLIEEHFGAASFGGAEVSIAHMMAPPGWTEPAQTPDFDEYTLMISGRKRVEIDDVVVEIGPGESLFIARGSRVRYANPFDQPAEYWSVCRPAFTPDRVHRESEEIS